MATKNEKEPILAQKDECLHLREFKDFLQQNVGVENVGGNQNNAITRSNSETYPINTTELKAELILSIWNQLQSKRCPRIFQLKILQHLLAKLEPECQNIKDNTTNTVTINDNSSEELQYDLAKLQKYVSNSLEKFLTHLNDNAEAQNLRSYADEETLCESDVQCKCEKRNDPKSKCTTFKHYVVGYIKNKPRKMEDKNVCLERFSEMYELKTKSSFYGVFDGHSGPLAACYATSQMPYLLAKELKENKPNGVDEYRECFETAFLQTDKQFIKKNISSGTTAVCALITETHLYVAWVGDSRALLAGPEVSLQLVKSHKPDSPEERQRIEEAGGSVMFVQGQWRVNGFLNVARSIGDYAVGNAVIAEPDFVDVPLCDQHDFLILGTDGLFDHVLEAKIVTAIYEALEDEEFIIEDIPKKLIEMAKDGDSQDNITVVIIFLKERTEIIKNRNKHKTVMS